MLAARFLPFDRNSGGCRGVGHAVQKGRDIGRSYGFAEQVSLPFGALAFRYANCPASSTPSAVVCKPNPFARPRMARTITWASGFH